MKKVWLSVLATITVVGTASAVPTPQQRREMCDQNPKTIWVEKTGACVPENTCESNNEDIKAAYCYAGFRQTHLSEENYAHRLVNIFMKRQNNGDRCAKISKVTGWQKSSSETYIKCNTEGGMYYVFIFPQFSTDSNTGSWYITPYRRNLEQTVQTICGRIYRGQFGIHDIFINSGSSPIPDLPGDSFLCNDVSQETCDNLAEDASEVSGGSWRAVYNEQQDKSGTVTKICGITKM